KSAFALVGMGAYASIIVDMPVTAIAVGLCAFFVVLNIAGVKEASIVQRILVTGLLAALSFYVLAGLSHVQVARYSPFMTRGMGGVFATAGFVFISYGGLTKIASVAEEVKKPGRSIPLAMILSLICVTLFYAAVTFITVGLIDPRLLSATSVPISDGAYATWGRAGAVIMAVAAMLAFISTANAGIIAASRYPVAMGRDRILPHFFKRLHPRFHTPRNSIVLTGAVMAVAIVFLKLELLVEVASTFLILLYLLANVSVIVMRESRMQNYQPKFRSPLYPWMQIAGVIASVFLLLKMGLETYCIAILFIICVFTWHMIYVRPHMKKDFALVHVITRIMAKEFSSSHLGAELMEIVRERDNIVEDRFDRLVGKCAILDIEGEISMEEFFKTASGTLSGELGVSALSVYDLLMERERETSTVIRSGLAIPHIVFEGEGKFSVLVARSKAGIWFPREKERVHVVFVLAGTKDERNFHLRALAAIAEIAQARDFDKSWLGARNIDEIRSLILLAERRRFHT
ncbi:MAG: amino acid permease, partial [Candidatus Omnitrophota bacterium]